MWALQDQYFVVELLSLRLYTIRSQLIVLSPEVSDNHFVKIFIPCNAMHIRIFGLPQMSIKAIIIVVLKVSLVIDNQVKVINSLAQ